MANNSCIGFCMRNQKLFQELKKIGINFSDDGRECSLLTKKSLSKRILGLSRFLARTPHI